MSEISALPGLGPKSQQMLAQAGIHSVAQLQTLGAVRAWLQVQTSGQKPGLNLLWALEGALLGQDWRLVAREQRTRLLLELDRLRQA
ncbi:TfoX/Sxy family protein [Massilia sp. W12]|uniref:TfoX/Sxy family protein n=1 Tax=Massilia sp. W12 TaxID=3126507 RepID=UPI0030CD2323